MRRLLVFGFILLVINLAKFSVIATRYSGCSKQSTSKVLGLREKLLCDYDNLVRPSQTSTTIVKLQLIPKFIRFDDESYTLVTNNWLSLSWKDPHLSWKDDREFSAIPSVHVYSSEIWTPDLSVYTSGATDYEPIDLPPTNCILTIDNEISCVSTVKYVTRCTPDYQHWPFDRQNCTLRLGSWSHTKAEIDYELVEGGLNMLDHTENREWKVLSVNVTKRMVTFKRMNDEHPSVFVNIILERHSSFAQSTVVAPAILLIITTLTVLWLNPMFMERMILAGINLICHLLCVMDVNWHVPYNGATMPSIQVFHKNSMIIASVAFFLTVILRQLKEISLPAPVWMTSTTSVILESKAGQFVLLSSLNPTASATLDIAEEDNAGLVQSNSSNSKTNPATSAWHHFATLIDRLSFAGIIFTYAIMLIVLIPKNDIKDS